MNRIESSKFILNVKKHLWESLFRCMEYIKKKEKDQLNSEVNIKCHSS